MLYFFEKGRSVLQCEVRSTPIRDTFAIVMTDGEGKVRTHYVTGSNDAHRRWLELEQELAAAGWSGPVGGD